MSKALGDIGHAVMKGKEEEIDNELVILLMNLWDRIEEKFARVAFAWRFFDPTNVKHQV